MKEYRWVRVRLGISITLVLLLMMFSSTPVKAEGEEDRPTFSGYTDVLSNTFGGALL